MRRIRAVAVLPTLFTLGNLVCGFFAIVVVSRIDKAGVQEPTPAPAVATTREWIGLIGSDDPTHNLMLCGALIFLSMVFDSFDGRVARITRSTSDFGGQLDSLCDLVSFGVAPALLLVKMCPQFTVLHREIIWFIAALFASCAALRLARFNVETDEEDDHTGFDGLPTPAAASVIASFAMFSYTLRNELRYDDLGSYDRLMQWILPPFAVMLAGLMVSRVPYPHVVTQLLRGQKSFPQVVGIVFAVMALAAVRWFAIPILCGLYAAIPALRYLWNRPWRRPALNEETRTDVHRVG